MRLKRSRLLHPQQTGHLEMPSAEPKQMAMDSIERDCLICYEGNFESMDGPVPVNADMLSRIAQNHNAKLASAKRLESGEVHPRSLPPIQLDHSEHSIHTVGRLIGQLNVKPYVTDSGEKVMGLFGRLRINGKENVEKVLDGRWSNLSIGADFEKGIISELTITPFPAAPEAAMLSKKKLASKKVKYKGYEIVSIEGPGKVYKVEIHKGGVKISDVASAVLEQHLGVIEEQAETTIEGFLEANMSKGENKMNKKLKHKKASAPIAKKEAPEAKKAGVEEKTLAQQMYEEIKQVAKEEKRAAKKAKLEEKLKKLEAEEHAEKHMEDTVNDQHEMSNAEDEAKVEKSHEGEKFAIDDEHKDYEKVSYADGEGEDHMSNAEDEAEHEEEHEHYNFSNAEDEAEHEEETEGKKFAHEEDEDEDKMKHKKAKRAKHMKEEDGEQSGGIHVDIDSHNEEEDEEEEEMARCADGLEDKNEAAKIKQVKDSMSSGTLARISKLAAGLNKKNQEIRLSLRKSHIAQRLSTLRAQAKITPAEVKKLSIDELAKKDNKTLDAVFKSYELREPVIHTGVYGSAKGIELSQLSAKVKEAEKADLEQRARMNMSLKKKDAVKNLSTSKAALADQKVDVIPTSVISERTVDYLQEKVFNLLDQGKVSEAKHLMGQAFQDVKRLRLAGGQEFVENEGRIAQTEKMFAEVQGQINEMLKIVTPLLRKK